MTIGQHTWREIQSQPGCWAAALDAFAAHEAACLRLLRDAIFDRVIVTGCGSTYYLALTAARLLRHGGLDAAAFPASELLLFPDAIVLPGKRTLLITVSRSGTTTETLRAQESFRRRGAGAVLCVTCDSESPLAQGADLAIGIDAAAETSVAQTRSFSSMCLVLQSMAGALAGDAGESGAPLPDLCRRLLAEQGELAQALGEDGDIKRFFFLGSDTLYGIACEAMLKMKEMSLATSEAFHVLEFRHGPMSLVGEDTLVIGLISSAAAGQERAALRDMRDLGARALALESTPGGFAHEILLPDDLPLWHRPALYLPPLQLMAYHRARFNGQDPDKPRNLSAVISLDGI